MMRLPLFPLQSVLFPGGRLALKVFEQRYLELTKACLAQDLPFGICAIKEGREVGALPYNIGTLARIIEWDMPEPGIFHLRVEGEKRFIIRHLHTEKSRLLVAEAEEVSPEPAQAVPADLRLTAEVIRRIMEDLNGAYWGPERRFDDAAWVGYRLAEALPLKLSTKQNLLEMNDSVARLGLLQQFLRRQTGSQ